MKLVLLFCTTTVLIVNAHYIPFYENGTPLLNENYPIQQQIDLPKIELPVEFNNNPFLKNSYGVPIIVNKPYEEYGVPQVSNFNNNNPSSLGVYPEQREDENHQKIGIKTHYHFEIPHHQPQENIPGTQRIITEATTTQEPIKKPYEEYGVPHQITTTTPSSTIKTPTLPQNQPPIVILSSQPAHPVSVEQNNQQNVAIFGPLQHQQQLIDHYSKKDDDCVQENEVTTTNFQYFNRIPQHHHQIIFAHPSAEQTFQFQHFQPILNNRPHVVYGFPYFRRYYNIQ